MTARIRTIMGHLILGLSIVSCGGGDSATGPAWAALAPMTTSRADPAVGVINGVIYVAGGYTFDAAAGALSSVEAYDPVTNSWTSKAAMPARRFSAASAVIGGILYVAGGFDENEVPVNSVFAYNPATNSWSTKTSMFRPRAAPAGGNRAGLFHVTGGSFDSTEVYNPATNTWAYKKGLGTEFYPGATGAVIGDTFYAIVGPTGQPDWDYPVVAFAGTEWTYPTAVPTSRSEASSAVLGGKLFVIGGLANQTTFLRNVEAWDPATNKWSSFRPLPAARYSAVATALDGVIYVIGGISGPVNSPRTEKSIISLKP
jgi:N-acetylneuraminic acid mutarotase